LVDIELFPEQLKKLVKEGDVAIRKPTKPLEGCTCECTYEHLAWITFVPPKIIIWALNVVRWFSGSSTPVKTILGMM